MPYESQSLDANRISDSPRELQVSWEPPLEPNGIITSYKVYCYETGSRVSTNDEDAVTEVVNGAVTEAVVAGLIPYTFYECYVTANTSVGEGNASESASARTDESGKIVIMKR